MESNKIYETANLDLAAFLILEGITYKNCYKSTDPRTDKTIGVFQFEDPFSKCLDLERVFLSSPYKKYRDFTKYLLKEVHSCVKK